MMQGTSRNVGDVIAEIKMIATQFSGCFVIVEGASDSKFISPKILKNNCEIVICGSKTVAIEATKISNKKNNKALGIIDDDFDATLNICHGSTDLINTETHDIETLLLSSSALDRIIGEYADLSKLNNFLAKEGSDFRSALIKRALPFGRYRLINAIHNLGVPFAEVFSPWKYINVPTWSVDTAKLEEDFVAISKMDVATIRKLDQELPQIPAWNLIQGHDAMAVLAIAMRSILCAKFSCSEAHLCKDLRLAFDNSSFQKTNMFAEIRTWEANKGVKLLREAI